MITIIGTMALVLVRSLISGINFTTNIADSMAAEQASQAGLEYGLNKLSAGAGTYSHIDLVSGVSYFDVEITVDESIDLAMIESVGHAGNVVKRHIITRQTEGIVSPNFHVFVVRSGDSLSVKWICRWTADLDIRAKNCIAPPNVSGVSGTYSYGHGIASDGTYLYVTRAYQWIAKINIQNWEVEKVINRSMLSSNQSQAGGLDIAVDPEKDFVYIVGDSPDFFCTYNKNLDASSRACHNINERTGGSKTVTTDGKDLYISNHDNNWIKRINVSSANPSEWSQTKITYWGFDDIAYNAANGTIYTVDDDRNTVCQVNKELTSRVCPPIKGRTEGGGNEVSVANDYLYITDESGHWIRRVHIPTWTEVKPKAKAPVTVGGDGIVAIPW